MKGPEDVEKFLSIPYEPPDVETCECEHWRGIVGSDGVVMVRILNGVGLPASWYAPEDFCMMWADTPDLIERLTSVATERLISYVDRLCQAGVRAFRIFGGEYASVQLGPRAFERLCVQYDRELVSIMHKHGAVAHYHNHGPVMRYLEGFAEIGMDSIDPMEAPPWGDADLAAARRALGDRICFIGNVDEWGVIYKNQWTQAISHPAEVI